MAAFEADLCREGHNFNDIESPLKFRCMSDTSGEG
jgi:hypothetical protein